MKDPRVDAYIEKSAEFARPILTHLRELIHSVAPKISETIKWGFPNFEYNGAILCHFASFKKHCSFGFWNGKGMEDPEGIIESVGNTSMGHFGKITDLMDLPSDEVITRYLLIAIKTPKGVNQGIKEVNTNNLIIPEVLMEALQMNSGAREVFDKFSRSNKAEYINWIIEAKTDATRTTRLTTAIEWISEGKVRNWKYIKQKNNS